MAEQDIRNLISEKEKQIKKLNFEIEELKQKLSELNCQSIALSVQDKINIFADYFKGRNDVYPHLYEKNNKINYTPTCSNFWKDFCNIRLGKTCKDCKYRKNNPLTLDVIKNHMYNNKTIGIYPLLEDDTCYFLAFDFDNKNNELNVKDDVLAFLSICDKYEIHAALEKSRSGMGFHIWIFFENKIKAVTARKLGSLLLSKTMEIRDILKIDSFDRMFPNQDFLPKGGYGNLIALPFQTEPSKYGNTLFIDRNFIQIKEQFIYLKNLKKLSLDEVFEKIKILSDETIDLSNDLANLKRDVKNKKKNNFEYPKSIDVILNDMIYIDKANLNAGVKSSFRRLATFANPEFYLKQRMRLSTRNIPMIIDCSKEDDKYLKIPRGTYDNLCELCKDQNVKINVFDNRNNGDRLDVHFQGALREEQEPALKELLRFDTGVLCAPTGFGKTVVGCKLIEMRKVNTIVLVPKLQLLNQWKSSIKNFLAIDEVGEISSKNKNITNIVDIASVKSLWNDGNVLDILSNYGMIIIDECHHCAAYTFEQVINTSNAKYIYGISATPERENGHTPIITMQCGDIRYKVNSLEFNQKLKIPMKVIKKIVTYYLQILI